MDYKNQYYPLIMIVLCAVFPLPLTAHSAVGKSLKNVEYQYSNGIHVKGEIEQSISADWNYELDEEAKEGHYKLEPSIALGFDIKPGNNTYVYVNLQYGRELKIKDKERTYTPTLKIDEGYIEYVKVFDVDKYVKKSSVTVGRFNMNDDREWFYDDEFDGIHLSFEYEPIDTEFTFSMNKEELLGSNLLPNDKKDTVNNYILAANIESFNDFNLDLSAYAVIRDDRASDNDSPKFLGLSAAGQFADKRIAYWTSYALARGKDEDETIEGYGFDIGSTLTFESDTKTYFTLAYAFGSGDGDDDSDFRQTDLQGNSDKFGGVTSFKYYGEIFDPELSNMHILTLGVGFRFNPTSSIDFLYHKYKQDKPLDKMRSIDLDIKPDGVNRDLGEEIDIVLGFELKKDIKAELVLGYFQHGLAFDTAAEDVFMMDAKFSYRF